MVFSKFIAKKIVSQVLGEEIDPSGSAPAYMYCCKVKRCWLVLPCFCNKLLIILKSQSFSRCNPLKI